ncbi:MAG: glycosyltransferase family 2 protein, partial [Rhodospirillales bacterium]
MPEASSPSGVSFVCTVYNKERYLESVLAALRAQEGGFEREFIFVDDGSSDRSVEILRDLTRGWPAARIAVQANQGPSGATNAGCRLARLGWIKPVGSDDILAPFATQLLLLRAREAGAAAIYSRQEFYRAPGDIAFDRDGALSASAKLLADPLDFAIRHNLSGTTGVLMEKRAFDRAGGCDPRVFAEDFSLCLRLASRERLATLDAVTCLGPAGEPGRIMTGSKHQLLHDYNAALHWFLADHPDLPARLKRLAFRRAAGRAWKWASREEGLGAGSRYFRLNLWSYAPVFCDFARAIGQTLPAFALSREV